MKQFILLTALFASLIFSSCNNDDNYQEPGTYPDKAAYATIHAVQSLEDDQELVYCFELDNRDRLFLAEDQLSVDYDFEDLSRVVIYYAIIEDYSDEGSEQLPGASYDCYYGLRLFGIRDVYTSEAKVIQTEEENDALKDHAISYVYTNMSFSNNHINMVAGLRADKMENIKLYLVENLFEEADKSKDGYLNLDLHYDRGTDEAMGSTYEEYVSLDVTPFSAQLADKKGVLLRMITLNSGTIYIKIDIDADADDDTLRASSSQKL